jgi:hypothetical protein
MWGKWQVTAKNVLKMYQRGGWKEPAMEKSLDTKSLGKIEKYP